ncbi:MAG: hypothetical protein R2762_20415 [Bryobacteraceae bacterium]
MGRDPEYGQWLSDGGGQLELPKREWAAVGSLVVHLLLGLLILVAPWGPPEIRHARDLSIRPVIVPLILPPELTQKDPNTKKPSLEVNLQGLLSEAQPPKPVEIAGSTRPAAPKAFESPKAAPAAPAPKPMIEAPKVDAGPREVGQLDERNLPGVGVPSPAAPPPQIQEQEKPKLAFEKPGADMGRRTDSGVGRSRIPTPQRSPVEEAARQLARGGGGGITVGDLGEGTGGLGESLNSPARPQRVEPGTAQ